MMYRSEKWLNGWLWYQTEPNGKWFRATTDEVIVSLHERIAELEKQAFMAGDA